MPRQTRITLPELIGEECQQWGMGTADVTQILGIQEMSVMEDMRQGIFDRTESPEYDWDGGRSFAAQLLSFRHLCYCACPDNLAALTTQSSYDAEPCKPESGDQAAAAWWPVM